MQEELNNKTEFYDYAQIIYSERDILDEIIPWASALFLMYWGQLEGWDNENWYTSYYSTKLGSVSSQLNINKNSSLSLRIKIDFQ